MRILESKLENGIISARLLVEYDDIVMAAGQQQSRLSSLKKATMRWLWTIRLPMTS